MSDIVTTQIFVDGEKGITATKMNNIVSGSVIQPDFFNNKASSPTLDPTDQLLELKGSGSYARITGSQLISSISSQVDPTPQIYATRLRSFNAVGNPNFECNQRSPATTLTNPVNGAWPLDRWQYQKSALTAALNVGQSSPNLVSIPGTNFRITSANLAITLTTAQASMAVADYCSVTQFVEGPFFRELSADVHSLGLIVYTGVAGLKFAVTLRDNALTRTLTNLCTVPSANTWTLITLPNLPVWDAGGTFSVLPGVLGYYLTICLAAGTNQIAPVAGTWQNGNWQGAPGMSNFLASPTSSVFYCAAIQHEPGAVSTTLMDKPFNQNYDECLRYFSKSYPYGQAAGSATFNGAIAGFIVTAPTAASGSLSWPKRMARSPNFIALYAPNTGAVGNAYNMMTGAVVPVTVSSFSEVGMLQVTGGGWTTGHNLAMHYAADTGW